ncbi:peptide chain release factor N(5)-glutamine methyltransferase [Pseudochelatococcus sp. B33]
MRQDAVPISRQDALRDLTARLAMAGIDTPALDARVLLMHAARLSATDLYAWPDEALPPDALERLAAAAARRLAREPLARILGEREFWGLPFALAPATLVPRPETELIVEAAIAEHARIAATRPGEAFRFLDLGTGSGCIAVALMHELRRTGKAGDARGVAVDLSPEAAATARRNADRNGVGDGLSCVVGSWGAALAGRGFDVILSNPPYIESAAIAGLDAEVREHDPCLALDGGADGLDAYRAIFAEAPRLLRADGAVIVEFGRGQAPTVAGIAAAHGFSVAVPVADLAGTERVIVATFS